MLRKLFWSGTPLLETVGENEPEVVEMREFVRKAVKQSIIPLRAYAKQYEKHLELFNLDINEYLRFCCTFNCCGNVSWKQREGVHIASYY